MRETDVSRAGAAYAPDSPNTEEDLFRWPKERFRNALSHRLRPDCPFGHIQSRPRRHPYANAGISDPAHVTQFVARLKQAVAADEHATVAGMVNYPLTVNSSGRPPVTYRNAAALSANYARVFTPEVKAAVGAAKADDLFSRDQGVMIGNGEIWMNERGGTMKIITVNHTR